MLLKRGIEAEEDILCKHLQSINYYRLSGYLYPYRNECDGYQDGTTLRRILQIYEFDSKLRILILEAIERIEVAVKTQIAYNFSHTYDPFAYKNHKFFPWLSPSKHSSLVENIRRETKRNNKEFIAHFTRKYGDQHDYLPIWMAVEIMTFGQTLTLYRGLDKNLKEIIAKEYRIRSKIFKSWLLSLNTVRNICAHHSRLWNITLGNKPLVPIKRNDPKWHSPVKIQNDKIFCILMIIKYILNIINPHNKWGFRLQSLLDRYDKIPLKEMGFPENWEQCPIWLAPHND